MLNRHVKVHLFLASIDIRDAYLHFPIAKSHQHFLRFSVGLVHFQFVSLTFGLSTTHRVFTKVLAPLMALLCARWIIVIPYFDDLLVMKAPSRADCPLSLSISLDALTRFSWVVNHQKSSLIPSQWLLFLGMIFDTQSARVLLTQEKVCLLRSGVTLLRGGSPQSVLPLTWSVVTKDASLSGWGAIFGSLTTQGLWSPEECHLQINLLQPSFWPSSIGPPFSRVIQLSKPSGGTRSSAALLEALRILQWAELHVPALLAVHIPGVDNWIVDFLSL